MKTDTNSNILNYIAENKEVTVHQITKHFGLSSQAIHRQVKKLVLAEKIKKIGTPPKVFYQVNKPNRHYEGSLAIDQEYTSTIQDKFFYITPYGEKLYGIDAFIEWCFKHGLDLPKTAKEYVTTINKYDQYKTGDLINGLPKLKHTFTTTYLDKLFYLDFYSIERFGKTMLGSLILYAKQSQDLELIKEIAEIVAPKIYKLIQIERVDAVGFVPPTLPRQVQFMHELRKLLRIDLPLISIVKVKSQVPVAQKTLNKLEDRITNASSTIFIDDQRQFKKILLIDDAVGSGATLNETARKIKEKKLVISEIIGLALIGSFKGFEVLNEA
jgi:hypoxanthine-guanine phosphoribosyltransferase